MMTPDDNRLVGHDDGFRVSDEAVERAVAHVMSVPQGSHVFRLHSVWPIAAAIALVLGMGVFLSDAIKPSHASHSLVKSRPCPTKSSSP